MRRRVQIVCSARSHPTKVAKIERIAFTARQRTCAENLGPRFAHMTCAQLTPNVLCAQCAGNEWRMMGGGLKEELLIDDAPLNPRDVYGSVNSPPDHEAMDLLRRRWPLECPLCGLRAEATFEKLEQTLLPYATRGDQSIPLALVVATL